MYKYFATILLYLCAISSHAFTLDFDNLPDGQSPGEAYASYGVHFSGGRIQNGQIAGAFTMTFDPGFDMLRLDYQYAKLNEGFSYVHSNRYGTDAMYRDPTINPYCGSQASCDAKGMRYISATELFPDRFIFEAGMGVTRITMGNSLTDNLVFTLVPAGGASNVAITGEVPEPSSSLVFLAGLLMLAGWRYRGQHPLQLAQQAK